MEGLNGEEKRKLKKGGSYGSEGKKETKKKWHKEKKLLRKRNRKE